MTAGRRTRILVAVGLFAFTIGMAAQPARQADSRTGLIVGQVVDAASGKPVSGVIVSIGGGGDGRTATGQAVAPPRILTGSSGRFVFRDLPSGSFTITATKRGYADGAFGRRRPGGPSQALTLTADERIGDVVVRMWKLGAIAGTVVDEAGERIVRVQLRAWRSTIVAGQTRLASVATTFTDDRGMYRFGALGPGAYVVGAAARHVIMPLSMTADMRPTGAAWLQFRDFVYGLNGGIVTPPPPGDRFFLYPPSFHAGTAEPAYATVVSVGSGEERLGVDLQAHPAPTVRVSGVLIAPDGPAARQIVRLVPDGRASVSADQDGPIIATDDAGAFVFPAIPPGGYTLRSSSALLLEGSPQGQREMVWAAMPLQVGSTDIERVTVALVPGLRISGRLEFDGSSPWPSPQRLAQVPLLVESADADGEVGPIPFVRANDRGEFSITGLVGGRYILRVTASPAGWMFKSAMYGGRDISSAPVDLSGFDANGVIITFTDRWSGISGMVQTRARNPDPDALVVMFPTDPQLWSGYGPTSRRVRGVRAGRNGNYLFNSVAPGDYYLAAIPDEKAEGWQDPAFLEELARDATRVRVGDGEKKRQDLHTREVR